MTKMVRQRIKKLCAVLESEVKADFSVVLTNDKEIHILNREYRKKDKATDVLSFPSNVQSYLGDLIISVDTARIQAKEYGVSLLDELTRLIVHGLLHLLGYDHEKVSPAAAKKMRRKEDSLMKELLAIRI